MTQETLVRLPLAGDEASYHAFVNGALETLATLHAGATAPGETYAGMLWLDTSGAAPRLRQRDQANSGWGALALDIASQAQAEAGTATDVVMTPQRTAQAVAALAPGPDLTDFAAGESGQPKIQPAALNVLLATGEAIVTDLDRVDRLLIFAKVTATSPSNGTNTSTVRYRLSSDNGISYGSYVNVAVTAVNAGGPSANLQNWLLVDISSHNAIQIDHDLNVGSGVNPGTGTQESFTLGIQGTTP